MPRLQPRVPEVTPDRVGNAALVDIRRPSELASGVIPGALLIEQHALVRELPAVLAVDQPIVLYCATGNRSVAATQALMAIGYQDVASLAGGIKAWRTAGLPVTPSSSTQRFARYDRQILLPEIGDQGQAKLSRSRVLVVGAGGLGSPAALYLAAAGVGTLAIVDGDQVELNNLHRQLLHTEDRIGTPKADSAKTSLQAINRDIQVVVVAERMVAANAAQLMAGYDVVVDGSDNFPTRYLLNDVALQAGVPVVHGSVYRFEGQVTVLHGYRGPCYRCLFPKPPPPAMAPGCSEVGVLGMLPGIIGTLQAIETLKLLLEIGQPLVGRLLTYDALSQEMQTLRVDRDPACLACGDPQRPPSIVDYDPACRPLPAPVAQTTSS